MNQRGNLQVIKRTKSVLNNNFHALTHKDFRYYWIGQCISLIGTWMQATSQSWLVLEITKSAFLLSVVGAIQFIPVMFFSVFAGALLDKFPKKKVLILTQTISMILAIILAILVFTGEVRYWHIVLLAFILGCTNALDMPTRQAFTVEIAGKEDLMNAIALNSATFNGARIIGPAIGGIAMAWFGAGWSFLLNGLSFIAVIYGLVKIEAIPYVRDKKDSDILKEIGDGIKYIKNNNIILETLLLVGIAGVLVFNYNIFLPVYTKYVLYKDSTTYGVLTSSLGVGSLFGALYASAGSKRGPKRKLLLLSMISISITFILLGINSIYLVTILLLIINGFFNILFSTTANSTLQMNSSDEYRARVMSVYSMVFAGITPIGNFTAGLMTQNFGVDKTFSAYGIIILVCLILFMMTFRNKKNRVSIR